MKEYGLLYYDIAATEQNLYMKVRRIIQRTCLPVNLSVYAFDWSIKSTIEEQLISTGVFSKANIHMIKFDASSSTEIETNALKQLEELFTSIRGRLNTTIRKIGKVDDTRMEAYLERMTRRVKNYDKILTIYEFANKARPALDILRKIINDEYKILKETNEPTNN